MKLTIEQVLLGAGFMNMNLDVVQHIFAYTLYRPLMNNLL